VGGAGRRLVPPFRAKEQWKQSQWFVSRRFSGMFLSLVKKFEEEDFALAIVECTLNVEWRKKKH
jgi:hypothetical protein